MREFNFKEEYRSDRDRLIQDFYIPCLEKSRYYDRAVGFFSSTSLAAVAQGLVIFIRAGGRMRLIASPSLSEEDIKAIAQGLKQRQEIVEQSILRELEKEVEQVVRDRLSCLAWMLAHGRLEIRLAVPKELKHQGIYHEKLGIFADEDQNRLVFTGSANETSSALYGNFECIDVFPSWIEAVKARAIRKAQNFEALWSNGTRNVEVMEFPDAARRSLLKLTPQQRPKVEEFHGSYDSAQAYHQHEDLGVPRLPNWLSLRDYQELAVSNWFKNKGRGTLKMATGSGKTITSLAIAARLHKEIQLQALIVVCPYRHLVQQWQRECLKFALKPILAYESTQKWQAELSHQILNLRLSVQPFVSVITTNVTFMGEVFQAQISSFPEKTLLIGDEAHNLGAKRLVGSLPKTVGLRLGLSATPERYFDDRGTQALFDYFGKILEPEFTLKDAIENGALVHYRYYPILVELTEEEALRYSELSVKIGRALALGDDEDNDALTILLAQRSRLIGAAENKLVALRALMNSRLQTSHTLFYCGDGSVEDDVTQESLRQLEAVNQILGWELGYRVNTYTAETSLDERENLRQQFETGDLQGLVAIRCLDEGVDIPAIQTAVIMASSSNPRQFIQRRGRVLRRHPGKQRAELFDMIVIPPDLGRDSRETERNLIRKELCRFVEFADLADNSGEARVKLLPVQQRYELMDI